MKFLLTFLPILLFALGLSAQNIQDTIGIPDVLVAENRIALPFSEQSRSIQLIHASQIAQMPVQSLNELLLFVAGVDVRQRGVHGVQADIGIRGGTFDQTLVLINGVKLLDPQTGHHSMNLPVSIDDIERIEILKGPGARVYGQNAFSGAINIVTKKIESNQIQLALRAGENALLGGHFSASHAGRKFQQMIAVAHDQSDGYRFNTDYSVRSVFYQNNLKLGEGDLKFIAGHASRKFGANGFYASPDFMDQYEETRTSFLHLEYQRTANKWQLTPRISWRQNKDDYVFLRHNPSFYQNVHKGQTLAAELHATHTGTTGTTGIGLELMNVNLESNNLGNRDRKIASLFVEHRFYLAERWDITPGVSMSYFTDFGNRFFPGIDIGYRINNRMKLYANTGYTYRVPTFTDLYYEDRANNGNPDLKPEEAIAYELGFKYNKAGMSIQTALFQRDGVDLIDWTKSADTLKWTPVNINKLSTKGFELSFQAYWPILLNKKHSFVDRIHFNYTYLNANIKDNEAAFSRYALENLRHQLVVGFTYNLFWGIQHSIYYRFTERVNLPSYQLVDTRINYKKKNLSLFFEATNLFSQSYKESNLVIMPGRWLRFGVGWQLRN